MNNQEASTWQIDVCFCDRTEQMNGEFVCIANYVRVWLFFLCFCISFSFSPIRSNIRWLTMKIWSFSWRLSFFLLLLSIKCQPFHFSFARNIFFVDTMTQLFIRCSIYVTDFFYKFPVDALRSFCYALNKWLTLRLFPNIQWNFEHRNVLRSMILLLLLLVLLFYNRPCITESAFCFRLTQLTGLLSEPNKCESWFTINGL